MGSLKLKNSDFGIARAMLVMNQFDNVCKMAEGICQIVPLKGIDLLTTLYNEKLDRAVGDIDLLVFPVSAFDAFIERLRKEKYTIQFDYLESISARVVKRKVALISPSPERCVDLDIHSAFVTKKFYSLSTGKFNEDALARCQQESSTCYRMDSIDKWLFLAQHACFHHFSDPKWLRDLMLLQEQMSKEQISVLQTRMTNYGFHRVCYATMQYLDFFAPDIPKHITVSKPSGLLWSNTLHTYLFNLDHCILRSVVRIFWEFFFIDKRTSRMQAYLKLAFPHLNYLKTIYRKRNILLILAIYPFHTLISALGICIFEFLCIFKGITKH